MSNLSELDKRIAERLKLTLIERIDRLHELSDEVSDESWKVGASGLLIQCRAQIESLTSENTRLRDLLYEEVMDSYYALTSHKQARYAGPREYADYVFSYEGIAPLPSHKGED